MVNTRTTLTAAELSVLHGTPPPSVTVLHPRHVNCHTMVELQAVMGEVFASGRLPRPPMEVLNTILEMANRFSGDTNNLQGTGHHNTMNPAFVPPSNGLSPIMRLPPEIRRAIFADCLPDSSIPILPRCSIHAPAMKGATYRPKRNTASDLMTINKIIKNEITLMLYEQRTFVIHVHAGLTSGGIEFLDEGRQNLLYHYGTSDLRFARFRKNDEFGFSRLKKIEIRIFEPVEVGRHDALALYYKHYALCGLIERGYKDRIVSLTITFARTERATPKNANRLIIARMESYWWNTDLSVPRATSIHGLSDVELVLRPFANLTHIHNVQIVLPSRLSMYAPTADFVSALEQSMMSEHGTLKGLSDALEHKMDVARQALEDHVFDEKYGRKGNEVQDVTEEELWQDRASNASGRYDGPDLGMTRAAIRARLLRRANSTKFNNADSESQGHKRRRRRKNRKARLGADGVHTQDQEEKTLAAEHHELDPTFLAHGNDLSYTQAGTGHEMSASTFTSTRNEPPAIPTYNMTASGAPLPRAPQWRLGESGFDHHRQSPSQAGGPRPGESTEHEGDTNFMLSSQRNLEHGGSFLGGFQSSAMPQSPAQRTQSGLPSGGSAGSASRFQDTEYQLY